MGAPGVEGALHAEHLRLPLVEDQVLLQAARATGGDDLGADRRVAHRQYPRLDAEAAGDLRLRIGRAAAVVEEQAAVEAGCQVAVGKAEPAGSAELLEAVEDGEVVVFDPPAALL